MGKQYKLIRCTINGKEREAMVDVRASLTDLLRNDFRLTSVKKGCEVGECGACNVLVNGECFNSCIYLAVWADGKDILTLEGLEGPNGEISDIQQAFIDEAAVQCGFCTPGAIMSAVEILNEGRELSDEEKTAVLRFVDGIPAATTCVHGDLQMSNVIRTPEGEDLWIDLGDFGYGHPLLDVAMWYFLTKLNTEERARDLFHLGLDELARAWDFFAEEYADAPSPADRQAFERQVLPYAALHMIYLGVSYGFQPGMVEFVKSILCP